MKTMLEVAHNKLSKVARIDFETLWIEVTKEASILEGFSSWSKEKQLDKKAEFYKLLVLDGRFIRCSEKDWALVENLTFDELQKMKGFFATEEIKD